MLHGLQWDGVADQASIFGLFVDSLRLSEGRLIMTSLIWEFPKIRDPNIVP